MHSNLTAKDCVFRCLLKSGLQSFKQEAKGIEIQQVLLNM